jgi:hypothetical protein
MIMSSIKLLFDDHLKQFNNQIINIEPDCCGIWLDLNQEEGVKREKLLIVHALGTY